MSHETLTPVPLNPDTAPQHEVVHGQVVGAETDDHGFMENALRSQNGETPPEPRKLRHNREVVESIDPQNIYLYGATATLAQMQAGRDLIHSEEFLAHTTEEQQYLIENILDRFLIEDDPDHDSYDSKRNHLRAILLESDEKFKKTARRKELDQARRDRVKLKRAYKSDDDMSEKTPFVTKLKALVGSEQEEGEDDRLETVYTPSQLRRQIKKLDKSFDGLLGDVADTGTTPGYLDVKYKQFNERIEAAGKNVNDRTRRSVKRETLRKLIDMDRLAARKGVEDDERNEYENELVDIFYRYTQLSDDEREVFGSNLGQRQQEALKLSRLERQAADLRAEKNDKIPVTSRLRVALGATASRLISASKDRWDARNQPIDDNDNGQLALFDEKPYKARHRRNKLDTLMNAPYAGFVNLREHMVKRRKHHSEKLAVITKDMTEDERKAYEKKRERRTKALTIGGIAIAVVGVAIAAKYGYDHFNGGDRTFESGDRSSGGLKDLLGIPEIDTNDPKDVEPGTRFESSGSDGGGDLYPQHASRVDNGEGLFQTFQEMGIPHDKWHDVLRESGPKLVRMGEAYSDPSLGGYGLNGDGKLSYRALDVINEAAKNVK